MKPTAYQPAQPNYFSSVQLNALNNTGSVTTTGMSGAKPAAAAAKAAGGGDAFGALWNQASVGIKKTNMSGAGPAMGQLAKEKSSAGIWGTPAAASPVGSKPAGGSATGDLNNLLG